MKELNYLANPNAGTDINTNAATNASPNMNTKTAQNLIVGRSHIRNFGKGLCISDIFEVCHNMPMAVFLDSSLNCSNYAAKSTSSNANNQKIKDRLLKTARFSIVAINPYLSIEEDSNICIRREYHTDNLSTSHTNSSQAKTSAKFTSSFEAEVQEELNKISNNNPTNLPLIDGAIGYLSYDYGRKFESIESVHPKTTSAPEARMTFYDTLLIQDHKTDELFGISHGVFGEQQAQLNKLELLAKSCSHAQNLTKINADKHTALQNYYPNFGHNEYKETLAQMIKYIVDGDIYIANMTQRLDIESTTEPYDTYRYLRTHNPAPFSAYLNYPEMQVACASMERFLQVRGGHVETRPIKGTRPRGAATKQDQKMREELANSGKDKSELLMIVDLERNDLNHVCVPGSVEVTSHFEVEEYATVFHLVSTIVGKLRDDVSLFDLIASAFPGGSITGAPKIRAMQIIDELEHGRRGLYTGSIGYLASDGNCDLNIVIRTAIYEQGVYSIGVGGGITCESDLEFEYEETLQKAKAVLEAIAYGGCEHEC